MNFSSNISGIPRTLFIHCPISSAFWLSLAEWLENYFPTIHVLTGVNMIFGLFGKEMRLINQIVLLGKKVIFQCKHLNVNPFREMESDSPSHSKPLDVSCVFFSLCLLFLFLSIVNEFLVCLCMCMVFVH